MNICNSQICRNIPLYFFCVYRFLPFGVSVDSVKNISLKHAFQPRLYNFQWLVYWTKEAAYTHIDTLSYVNEHLCIYGLIQTIIYEKNYIMC